MKTASPRPALSRRAAIRLAAWLVAGATLPGGRAKVRAADPATAFDPRVARFGYSRRVMRNVNETDFRSAMSVYSRVIARDAKISTAGELSVFNSAQELAAALRSGAINVVAAPADELIDLPPEVLIPEMISATTGGRGGVEYLLLAHVDGSVATLADLKGKTLAVLDNTHGLLATPWLELVLVQAALGRPADVLQRSLTVAKPALAALPVFFRQLDACIITRSALATLAELNPQVARKLRIVATSPTVFPILTGFGRTIDPALHAEIVHSIMAVRGTPAGRQLLTVFQTDELGVCDAATLAATRRLLADHARLVGPATSAPR